MQFVTEMWHPNISAAGDVCISILHEPGEDRWGYERAEERWLPVHTVETIIMSVISMLAEPNPDSPANVDAAVSFYYFIFEICLENVSWRLRGIQAKGWANRPEKPRELWVKCLVSICYVRILIWGLLFLHDPLFKKLLLSVLSLVTRRQHLVQYQPSHRESICSNSRYCLDFLNQFDIRH